MNKHNACEKCGRADIPASRRQGEMMERKVQKKIQEILGQMKCPKDFTCARSGFDSLCKAAGVGLEEYLQCLEKDPARCKFALSFGDVYFCQCPLRVFIAKHSDKLKGEARRSPRKKK